MIDLALVVASAALAQQPVTWTWQAKVDQPVIDPDGVTSQKVTLSALMEADAPTVFLSAVIFDTLIAANPDYGTISGWTVLNSLADLTGDLTTSDGTSLYGTNAGQLCLWGPCTMDNPVDILEFTWQLADDVDLDAPVTVTYATDTLIAVVKAGTDHGDAQAYEAEVINEATFGWTIVPAPATLALLAAPVITRRRRA